MIDPLRSLPQPQVTRLRNLSPLTPLVESPNPSASEDLLVRSPCAELHQSSPTPNPSSMLGQALLTGCLAIGAVSGVMAAFPAVAQAQVQVAPVRSNNPAVRQLVASSLVTGRIPPGKVAERMDRLPPAVRSHLQDQSPQVQQSYVDLDVGARRWLAGQVSGSSPTFLGKVKHRPAFISGKVVIVNLFDAIKGEIKDEVQKGTIPRQAQPRIEAYLNKLKQMKPAQREALAKALQAEFPPAPATLST